MSGSKCAVDWSGYFAADYLLWRHIQGDGPQIHLLVAFNAGEDKEYAYKKREGRRGDGGVHVVGEGAVSRKKVKKKIHYRKKEEPRLFSDNFFGEGGGVKRNGCKKNIEDTDTFNLHAFNLHVVFFLHKLHVYYVLLL